MDPPVSKKQKIMGSEMTNLEGIQTVTDMQFLPLNRSDQTVTRLALQKTLSLCGIPRRRTEDRSAEEVKSEQESLQRQLDALQKKEEKNAAILSAHEEVEAERAHLTSKKKRYEANVVKCNEILVLVEQHHYQESLRRVIERQLQSNRKHLSEHENRLKDLESPLRN